MVKNPIGSFVTRLLSVLTIILVVACTDTEKPGMEEALDTVVQMEVFKSPSCGCCGKWVEHVEAAGFAVAVKNRQNLSSIKREFGIGPRYQSCHTGVAEGYVFEGHIPASFVRRFLEEKPVDAIGLAVPGMPVGSPGMEMGERFDSYDIMLLKADGSSEVYAHVDAPQ